MAQTTTDISGCDAVIYLDDDLGAATDISGSSNRVSLRFRRQVNELRIADSGSYPFRVGCFQDCEVTMRILYTTADDEALDLINTWHHAAGVMSARTLTVYLPTEAAGNDEYSGEFILRNVNIPITSREGGPTAVNINLISADEVSYAPLTYWWDPDDEDLCIWAAYQPKGAASFALSLIDQSGNGHDAGDPGGGGTPSWTTANGWDFDGVQTYLTTTFIPEDDQGQSVLVQFASVTGTGGTIFGEYEDANTQFRIMPAQTSSTVLYANGQQQAVGPTNHTSGNLGIAGSQGYRDGVADGAALGAWVVGSKDACYIGAYNDPDVAVGQFTNCYVYAVAIYDCTLTSDQVAAVVAQMELL